VFSVGAKNKVATRRLSRQFHPVFKYFYLSLFDLCEEEHISFDGEFLTVWHFVAHG
jgi:hypothetical protein